MSPARDGQGRVHFRTPGNKGMGAIPGIDVAGDVRPALSCLVDAGLQWVGRYYCDTTHIVGKKLTPIEANAIAASGLSIVSVWENGAADTYDYFTVANGRRDGAHAALLARSLGQPVTSPIYFAVDFDATSAELAVGVTAYFDGLAKGLQLFVDDETAETTYPIGVYGSGLTCETLMGSARASLAWMAQASGWAGFKTFNAWMIAQGPQKTMCGITGDTDMAVTGYGGWKPVGVVQA